MEKILITGANGLLGTSLGSFLKERGENVVTSAFKSKADFNFDLSVDAECNHFLELIKPTVIINLAGMTSVEFCEENLHLAYAANTRTVENLAKWIIATKSKCHLIHISTDHVYDGPGLHAEENVKITNNYAMTKYAGELAAAFVPCTILRTNFVGKSKINSRESLTDWVYKSVINNKCVQVLDDVYFSPLSIKRVVNMIYLVLYSKPIGVFNLGSDLGMSKAEFDFAFAKSLGFQADNMTKINADKALFLKAYRPKNMCMNSSKFETIMDVKLPKLIEIIDEVANEYRN